MLRNFCENADMLHVLHFICPQGDRKVHSPTIQTNMQNSTNQDATLTVADKLSVIFENYNHYGNYQWKSQKYVPSFSATTGLLWETPLELSISGRKENIWTVSKVVLMKAFIEYCLAEQVYIQTIVVSISIYKAWSEKRKHLYNPPSKASWHKWFATKGVSFRNLSV